jgi:hypothetical protein
VKRGSEKVSKINSVAIAGIYLCHIYIFVIHAQQDATHRSKKKIYIYIYIYICVCIAKVVPVLN